MDASRALVCRRSRSTYRTRQHSSSTTYPVPTRHSSSSTSPITNLEVSHMQTTMNVVDRGCGNGMPVRRLTHRERCPAARPSRVSTPPATTHEVSQVQRTGGDLVYRNNGTRGNYNQEVYKSRYKQVSNGGDCIKTYEVEFKVTKKVTYRNTSRSANAVRARRAITNA